MVREYSLYIHIPFCTKKCNYCSFYIIPFKEVWSYDYAKVIGLEWAIKRRELAPSDKLISVFFGGGTPSLLSPSIIRELLSLFDISDDTEITLEANPEDVSKEKFAELKSIGVNRISIGVQSFNNKLLHLIGRNHKENTIFEAITTLFDIDITNISVDLIYELPSQSLSVWQQTLFHVSQLPVTHVSLYNLSLDPYSVFYKYRDTIKPLIPKQEIGKEMLEFSIQFLTEHGFQRYEISAFAKPSYQSVHNLGYWTNREFFGLGVSASSFWNKSRFKNISHFHKYCRNIKQGNVPLEYREKLHTKEKNKETLALGLRLIKGISLKEFRITELLPLCLEIEKQDLAVVRDYDKVKLTHKGLLFHDFVAELIMSSS